MRTVGWPAQRQICKEEEKIRNPHNLVVCLCASALLVGCSGDEYVLPPEEEPGLANEEEKIGIQTKSFDGMLAGKWWVEGIDAVATLGEEYTVFNTFQASGHLFDGDNIASKFKALEAEGSTSGRLILRGDVQVTSETASILLTADQVIYNEATQLIEAEGNVLVSSDSFESGPYDKLVTTPSVDRIGTPDNFLR